VGQLSRQQRPDIRSVDKAVTFVMEELSALERSDASIVTRSRLIGIHDIERMYTARKASCGI